MMNRIKSTLLFICLLTAFSFQSTERTRLSDGWFFYADELPITANPFWDNSEAYRKQLLFSLDNDTLTWRPVQIPHDYGKNLKINKVKSYGGTYIYDFNAKALSQNTTNRLVIDRFSGTLSVFFNGFKLGVFEDGLLGISLDLDDYINRAPDAVNRIVVSVSADGVRLANGFGAGLNGRVSHVVSDDIRVKTNGITVFPTIAANKLTADLEVEVELEHFYYGEREIRLSQELKNAYGVIVSKLPSERIKLSQNGETAIKQILTIAKPKAWNPVTPEVYTLVTKVFTPTKKIEQIETKVAFKSVVWKGNRLFLNGNETELKGLVLTEYQSLFGTAIPYEIMRISLIDLKNKGCNLIIPKSGVASPLLLDLTDSLGIMVIESVKSFGSGYEQKETLKQIISRDKNRPSVISWSLNKSDSSFGETEALVFKRMQVLSNFNDAQKRPVLLSNPLENLYPVVPNISFNAFSYPNLHIALPSLIWSKNSKLYFPAELLADAELNGMGIVFSNYDETEILFDRKRLGRFETDASMQISFQVPDGIDVIEFNGIKDNRVVQRESISLDDYANKIDVKSDKNKVKATGTDLLFIEVRALDNKGRKCVKVNSELFITVDGPLDYLGAINANSDNLDWVDTNQTKLANGQCTLVFRSKKEVGEVEIVVNSTKVKAKRVLVEVTK